MNRKLFDLGREVAKRWLVAATPRAMIGLPGHLQRAPARALSWQEVSSTSDVYVLRSLMQPGETAVFGGADKLGLALSRAIEQVLWYQEARHQTKLVSIESGAPIEAMISWMEGLSDDAFSAGLVAGLDQGKLIGMIVGIRLGRRIGVSACRSLTVDELTARMVALVTPGERCLLEACIFGRPFEEWARGVATGWCEKLKSVPATATQAQFIRSVNRTLPADVRALGL